MRQKNIVNLLNTTPMINLKVAIYQDYIQNSFELFQFMSSTFKEVFYINYQNVCEGILLSEQVDVFVMPGGADLYYVEKLNGKGNENIKNYVASGGIYLGICAGAYYGSDYVKWAAHEGEKKIFGKRELSFFKGEAVGPIYEFIEDRDFNASHVSAVKIRYGEHKSNTAIVKYGGGPIFYPYKEGDTSFKVLATYDGLPNSPMAVVECYFGKGMALLSSPHFETSGFSLALRTYKHQNKSYSRYKEVAEKLNKERNSQLEFWSFLLKRIVDKHKKALLTLE